MAVMTCLGACNAERGEEVGENTGGEEVGESTGGEEVGESKHKWKKMIFRMKEWKIRFFNIRIILV